MQNSSRDKPRAAVPRWRALAGTPRSELESYPSTAASASDLSQRWTSQLNEWRAEGSLEASADILDYGLAVGDRTIELEGAAGILSRIAVAPKRLVASARQAFSDPTKSYRASILDNEPMPTAKAVYGAIRRLKGEISKSPRNVLLHVEIARLYAISAQFDTAERHVVIAGQLGSENRYVLRSLTNFYCMRDGAEEALRILRRAESFRYDPWIQSAELAASQLAMKPTRLPKSVFKQIRQQASVGRDESELTAGLAWLEHESGVRSRQVNKLIRASVADPTENALAQAMWVSERLGRNFQNEFPEFQFSDEAHEAKASAYLNQMRYLESEREASLWLTDQPLEERAVLTVSYTNLVQLCDYRKAAEVAERGLELHYGNWAMHNCALLAFAYTGRIEEARLEAREMLKLGGANPETKPFLLAGLGLISFMEGDADAGRQFYIESIRSSRRINRPTLVIRAVIYWLEREVVGGLIDAKGLAAEIKRIEAAIYKMPIADRVDLLQVLAARRQVMERTVVGYRAQDGIDQSPQPSRELTPNN